MSEIQRYKMEFAPGSGGWIKQTARGELVLFTDHEAAIALRTRVCAEAFEDELARTEERVLADAKARIGRLAAPNGSYGEAEWGFLRGVTAALAVLTQPQTEKCPNPDCEGGTRPNGEGGWDLCPDCLEAADAAGGGAATPRGVADADPVARITKKVNESLGAELADACDHIRALIGGDVGAILYAREWLEEHDHEEREPGPYAKAFRERVCPVPEFPGIEKEES